MRRNPHAVRQKHGSLWNAVRGIVRRVVFESGVTGGLWNYLGYQVPGETDRDGEGEDPIEVFQGLYVYARPASGDKAEGLVVHVGADADHPSVAALRNEDARKRYVATFGDLQPGEMAIFNSKGTARVILNASEHAVLDGTQIKLGKNAAQAIIKGTSYISAEGTFLSALSTFVSTCVTTDAGIAAAALGLAITAFSGGSYLSTKSKTE
jgi:phage gp45-like